MTNLVQETLEHVIACGHGLDDVAWVGSRDGAFALSWPEFAERFVGLKYSSGYGSQEIADDLVVVFSDGSWLERNEYDGSEWWEGKRLPHRANDARPFDRVKRSDMGWVSLADLNPRPASDR